MYIAPNKNEEEEKNSDVKPSPPKVKIKPKLLKDEPGKCYTPLK